MKAYRKKLSILNQFSKKGAVKFVNYKRASFIIPFVIELKVIYVILRVLTSIIAIKKVKFRTRLAHAIVREQSVSKSFDILFQR